MIKNRVARLLGLMAMLTLPVAACDNILDVTDPGNFTDEDLDKALDAVAAGVEGSLHGQYDGLAYFSALLSDEWQHTGTWAGWDDVDHGRLRYSSSPVDGVFAGLLRARFASQDAQARFERVLEGAAASSPLMARVVVVEGLIDLILAENFCEAPSGQGTTSISDMAMYQQAIDKLTSAAGVADNAGEGTYATAARAGIARAHLMLGNYSQADQFADPIATDFSYNAIYTVNATRNDLVSLSTIGFNNAGGMREKWWARVDVDERKLLDPWTDEPDPRIGIRFDDGVVGVDGITPYYSQWKYTGLNSQIEIIGGREMRLIQAEVAWRNDDFGTAIDILNDLREDAGLTAVANPGTSQGVFDILLHERFAENFMEAHRMNDLYRFDLVDDLVADGDFNSPTANGTTFNNRALKFPLDDGEALNNSNIEDDVSARCMPTQS